MARAVDPRPAGRRIGVRRVATLLAAALLAAGVGKSVPAGAATVSSGADADSRVVQASAASNYGNSKTLQVDGDPAVESYLRFVVQGVSGTVRRARLRLWVTDATSDGPVAYRAGTIWSERSISWSNRPPRLGGPLADLGRLPANTWAEFDVTGAVLGNGTYAFNLVATSADGVTFASSEAKKRLPELLVESGTIPGDTTPPNTTIESGPSGDMAATGASFGFSSNESGVRFECRLDTAAYTGCTSPATYSGLARGDHTFLVRAIDTDNNVDPTPASRVWRIVGAAPGPRQALLAPATGARWGVHFQVSSSLPIAEKKAALQAFEASVGRTLGVDMYYEPWGHVFPEWRETWDLAQGRIPMISWGKTTTTEVTAGLHDAYIRARADGIKALGRPIFLRWFWEMDGSRNAPLAVSPASYIAAWRHIRGIFAERGADNVAWVWCPNASGFDDGSAPAFYPGDEWVDWACADGYNWYPDPGRSYEDFESKFRSFHDWARSRGKPAMVGEYAAQRMEPGRRAQWVNDARTSLKTRLTGILAVLYFHSAGDHDWRLTSEPDALAAFSAMGLDPYFNP